MITHGSDVNAESRPEMDVFFSTVVREAPIENGGELVRVNWQSLQVEKTSPLTPDEVANDPNPRGNTRGGRGIARVGDLLCVATYNSISVVDRDLTPVNKLSN